ncbi:hypothetical protein [Rubrivirga sp. IMCC43871]|uniref:hypothetical protein n=1 Tax=Rubrivirga sp. IMCC43871 TaxID=3391575 RepID=UPI0039902893
MRALLFALVLAAPGVCQVAPALPDTTAGRYGSTGALVLLLSEYGLGVGGALRGRVSDDVSLVLEISAGAGRDEREQSFAGFLGERRTPFKRNYVALVPLHVGVEVRLLRQQVEDNVRPFVHLSAGPTFGYQWPYFDDADGDGRRGADEEVLSGVGGLGDGEARVGIGGTLALGTFFGRGERTRTGVRFGLQGTYFPVELDLLEIRPDVDDPSRHTFVTPVMSFHVARRL